MRGVPTLKGGLGATLPLRAVPWRAQRPSGSPLGASAWECRAASSLALLGEQQHLRRLEEDPIAHAGRAGRGEHLEPLPAVPVHEVKRGGAGVAPLLHQDRKSTRLNSSHSQISYAVFCLKKKKKHKE